MNIRGLLSKAWGLLNSTNKYEGGSTSQRIGYWGTDISGPNRELKDSLPKLRSRSHELVRNNPHAYSAREQYVSNLIGTGIRPRWNIDEESLKDELQELWEDSVPEADFDEKLDFYGLQVLVGNTEYESGEALALFKPRPLSEGLVVPLQLQILEPDHLDCYKDLHGRTNYIEQGIEFNSMGKRTAYHLFKQHPGENVFEHAIEFESHRIPASEVLHIFRPLRPGQVRGEPHLTQVIILMRELDQYQDAELVRKKLAAMFSAFITRKFDDIPGTKNNDTESTGTEDKQISLEPGLIQYLEDNEDIRFSEPVDVGSNTDKWVKYLLHGFAVGADVTYEQLTGDLTGVNYSSIRAGLIEMRRRIEILQNTMVIHQFCRPYVNRWVETAVMSGAIHLPDFVQNRRKYRRVEWMTPGWEPVDEVKTATANLLNARAGFKPRSDIAAKLGHHIEDIYRKNKLANDLADKYEQVYDSDPRKTTKSGVVQKIIDQTIKNALEDDNDTELVLDDEGDESTDDTDNHDL